MDCTTADEITQSFERLPISKKSSADYYFSIRNKLMVSYVPAKNVDTKDGKLIINTAELLAVADDFVISPQHYQSFENNKKMDFLIKFTKELNKEFDNQHLRMQEIARKIALSERQLYRYSKQYLNLTPNGYLRRYRLEKAVSKIKQGNTLGNISFEVGFSSHSYFCRCFKESFGATPTVFMQFIFSPQRVGNH